MLLSVAAPVSGRLLSVRVVTPASVCAWAIAGVITPNAAISARRCGDTNLPNPSLGE